MGFRVRRLPLLIGALLLAVVVPIVGTVGVVTLRPQWLVNDRSAGWLARYAERRGWVDLRSPGERIELGAEVRSESLLVKRIVLRSGPICAGSGRFCLGFASIEFQVDLASLSPKITAIGPASLRELDARLRIPAPDEAGAEPAHEASAPFELPGWLRAAHLAPIDVQARELRLEWPDGARLEASGQLRLTAPGATLTANLNLTHRAAGAATPGWRGDATLRASSAGDRIGDAWDLELRADARGPGAIRVSTEGDLSWRPGSRSEFKLQANQRGRAGGPAVEGSLAGNFGPDALEAGITARLRRFSRELPLVMISDCRIRQAGFAEGGRLTAGCHARANLDGRGPRAARLPLRDELLPPSLGLRLELEAATASFPPDPDRPSEGRIRLKFDPITLPKLGELRAETALQFEGIWADAYRALAGDARARWSARGPVDVDWRIRDFQRLVSALRATPWAVPAPLNDLAGTLALTSKGELRFPGGRIPFELRSRLAAPPQRLDAEATGELELSPAGPRLEARVRLSAVSLLLPRLQFAKPPALARDSRIILPVPGAVAPAPGTDAVRISQASPEPPGFRYSVRVDTPPERPLELISNLAGRPAPLQVHLRLASGEGLQGEVVADSFPISLFRRRADVERFRVEFGTPDPIIDGSIRVSYADYLVRILLTGSTEHPRILLRSDPPLPENQLASVLLFGRPPTELDSSETESVSGMRAAWADGAVSLASLYLLASTPIESVGYDPATGAFTAKVRVVEGTSLSVGESARHGAAIGIRRRLGGRWTATTEAGVFRDDRSDRAVSAILEWRNRY